MVSPVSVGRYYRSLWMVLSVSLAVLPVLLDSVAGVPGWYRRCPWMVPPVPLRRYYRPLWMVPSVSLLHPHQRREKVQVVLQLVAMNQGRGEPQVTEFQGTLLLEHHEGRRPVLLSVRPSLGGGTPERDETSPRPSTTGSWVNVSLGSLGVLHFGGRTSGGRSLTPCDGREFAGFETSDFGLFSGVLLSHTFRNRLWSHSDFSGGGWTLSWVLWSGPLSRSCPTRPQSGSE